MPATSVSSWPPGNELAVVGHEPAVIGLGPAHAGARLHAPGELAGVDDAVAETGADERILLEHVEVVVAVAAQREGVEAVREVAVRLVDEERLLLGREGLVGVGIGGLAELKTEAEGLVDHRAAVAHAARDRQVLRLGVAGGAAVGQRHGARKAGPEAGAAEALVVVALGELVLDLVLNVVDAVVERVGADDGALREDGGGGSGDQEGERAGGRGLHDLHGGSLSLRVRPACCRSVVCART